MQPLYRSNKPLVKRITLLVLHMVPATAPEWFDLPFRGYLSLTHFGAPMGSQAKVAKFRPFLRQILTFLTPHPANQVNFSLSKMAFRGVSHTVLQVLCSTGTSGGYFRPSKVSFGAISAILGNFFYICKNTLFVKRVKSGIGWNLCVDSQTSPLSGPKIWQLAIFGSKNIVEARGEQR